MATKTCTKCGRSLPISEFAKEKKGLYGIRSQCRECEKERLKKFYQGTKEARVEAMLKHRYGITLDAYRSMLLDQEGCCFICGKETELVVDHETGQVRALLCRNCNVLLGVAHEDPFILAAAIQYLEMFDRAVEDREA